jgi:dipeptidyl aminopeptidase/acylaminoacyl peptidase
VFGKVSLATRAVAIGWMFVWGTGVWAQKLDVAVAATVPTARYGVSEFARRPLTEKMALSPDGKRYAAVVNKGDLSVLVTRAVAGGPLQQLMSTDNLRLMFNWVRWVNNDRLLFSLRRPGTFYAGRAGKVGTWETRLMAANADGSHLVNLLSEGGERMGSAAATNVQDDVIDWLPQDGKHVLLTLPADTYDQDRAVFKVDVDTGKRSLYQSSRIRVFDWLTDAQHRVRVATAYPPGKSGIWLYDEARIVVWVCDPDGGNWRELRRFEPGDASRIQPLGFGKDPNLLYLLADHQGRMAVQTLDLRDVVAVPKLVLADPEHDLEGSLITEPLGGEAVGLRLEDDASGAVALYWDGRYKALQGGLDAALPASHTELLQLLGDGNTYLARVSGNGMPTQYLLGDRAKGSATLLSEAYPQLDPTRLARKEAIVVKARDGLALHALLTRPRQAKLGERLPLVVYPHGGPLSHDDYEFEPEVAFMAELGYAVLQVDFRGSTGYGRAFAEMGFKHWGLEMQDDLVDAAQALVDQGVADQARIAIVGSSYGGYAALMGVVKTPRFYRGAFAYAPLTDLLELAKSSERLGISWSYYDGKRQLGDPDQDRDRLVATSPRLQAHKIQVPVVLMHGTRDLQAAYRHSAWMGQALEDAGKDVKFITLEDGDHQLSHQAYRTRYFQELRDFLQRVLGPGV